MDADNKSFESRYLTMTNDDLRMTPDEESEIRWDAIADLMVDAGVKTVTGFNTNQFHIVHGIKP